MSAPEKLSLSNSLLQDSINNRKLLYVRENRKTMDNSVQTLANRITFLRHQEIMTNQRIREMKKNSMDLYLKKKSIENMRKVKNDNKSLNKNNIENIREQIKTEKEKAKQGHENLLEYITSQRRNRSEVIRLGSKKSDEFIRQRRVKDLNMKSLNYSMMKKKEIEGSFKIESFKNSMREKGKMYYLKQIEKEESIINNRRDQIKKMDGFEALLMDKINLSLRIHEKTFEELECLKTLQLSEFEEKFKTNLQKKKLRKAKIKTQS